MYDEMNGSADSTENSAQAAETGSQQSGYYQQDSSSQQGVYTQNTYDYYATEENRQPEGGAGFGIASLVLGILALITFCTLCLNIPLAILAIIFAIIQLVKGNGKGLAIGGLITSVLSVVACLVFYFVVGLNAAKFSV